MPWTGDSFKRHNSSLSDSQSEKGATAANAVLERTGDEGQAVRVGNAVAEGTVRHAPYRSSRKVSE